MIKKEAKSQRKLISKIEELAQMRYDDIQYIVKKDKQYPVESKNLSQILYDLENGFTAINF